MKSETLQKVLPASALGISIIIHLCIFMAISGFVLIEAYNPPQAFVADAIQPSNTVSDLPPEPQPEQQAEPTPSTPNQDPTPQDLTPPVTVTSTNVDIIASTAPSTTPTFTVAAAPAGAVFSTTPGQQQEAKPKDNNPANLTKRSMATLFGNTGVSSGALVGYLYDLKQTRSKAPSPLANDKYNVNGQTGYRDAIRKFMQGGWDEGALKEQYYRCRKPMSIFQFFIPSCRADLAPAAFKVENEMKPARWIAVYHGTVTPPSSGRYRLAGLADDILIVKLGSELVFDGSLNKPVIEGYKGKSESIGGRGLAVSEYVHLSKDKSYPIQVILGEEPGGIFYAWLLVQKEGSNYKTSANNKGPVLPVLQFAPAELPKYTPIDKGTGDAPHVTDEGVVFGAGDNDKSQDSSQ